LEEKYDSGTTAGRAQLEAAWNAKDVWGVKLRLRKDNFFNFGYGKADSELSIKQAYAWGNFFNNALKVTAGRTEDNAWKMDFGEGDDWTVVALVGGGEPSDIEVRLEIKPIAGLSFGPSFYAPTISTLSIDPSNGIKFADVLAETAFGAEYKTDLFTIDAGIKLDSNLDDTGTKTEKDDLYDTIYTDANYASWGFAAVQLNLIDGLKIQLGGKATDLGDSDKGYVQLQEFAEFGVNDALKLRAYAGEWFYNDKFIRNKKEQDKNAQIKIGVGGNYKLTKKWNADLFGSYTANTVNVAKTDNKDSVFGLTAQGIMTVGAGATFGVRYDLAATTYDQTQGTGKTKTDGATKQYIGVNWIWTF
jgi:hypothetical protein